MIQHFSIALAVILGVLTVGPSALGSGLSLHLERSGFGAEEETFDLTCQGKAASCDLKLEATGAPNATGRVPAKRAREWVSQFAKSTHSIQGRSLTSAAVSCRYVLGGKETTVGLSAEELRKGQSARAARAFTEIETKLRDAVHGK